jgi:aldehyde:ferredoxin oxidoreductase
MQLSDEHIQEFIKIYKKLYGIKLSDVDAREKGTRIVELMRLINKPISRKIGRGLDRI